MIKEYVIKKRMFLFDESDIEEEKIHTEIEDKLNEEGIVYDRKAAALSSCFFL